MADQIPISGEWISLVVDNVPLAASRTFTLNVDRATYANFVARGTTKWRTNYPADIGGTIDIDGLVVTEESSAAARKFNELFTYIGSEASITVLFTLRSNTLGEPTFAYSCSAHLTSLSAAAPQFGEATYSCSLILTGEMTQSTGTLIAEPSIQEGVTVGDTVIISVV